MKKSPRAKKRSSSPSPKKSRSPSPKRSSSPKAKESRPPSPQRSSSPSPKRSSSPKAKESRPPTPQRSSSPKAKENRSPKTKKSSLPRTESNVNQEQQKTPPRQSAEKKREGRAIVGQKAWVEEGKTDKKQSSPTKNPNDDTAKLSQPSTAPIRRSRSPVVRPSSAPVRRSSSPTTPERGQSPSRKVVESKTSEPTKPNKDRPAEPAKPPNNPLPSSTRDDNRPPEPQGKSKKEIRTIVVGGREEVPNTPNEVYQLKTDVKHIDLPKPDLTQNKTTPSQTYTHPVRPSATPENPERQPEPRREVPTQSVWNEQSSDSKPPPVETPPASPEKLPSKLQPLFQPAVEKRKPLPPINVKIPTTTPPESVPEPASSDRKEQPLTPRLDATPSSQSTKHRGNNQLIHPVPLTQEQIDRRVFVSTADLTHTNLTPPVDNNHPDTDQSVKYPIKPIGQIPVGSGPTESVDGQTKPTASSLAWNERPTTVVQSPVSTEVPPQPSEALFQGGLTRRNNWKLNMPDKAASPEATSTQPSAQPSAGSDENALSSSKHRGDTRVIQSTGLGESKQDHDRTVRTSKADLIRTPPIVPDSSVVRGMDDVPSAVQSTELSSGGVVNQSETGKSETGKSETDRSETGKSEIGKSETDRSETENTKSPRRRKRQKGNKKTPSVETNSPTQSSASPDVSPPTIPKNDNHELETIQSTRDPNPTRVHVTGTETPREDHTVDVSEAHWRRNDAHPTQQVPTPKITEEDSQSRSEPEEEASNTDTDTKMDTDTDTDADADTDIERKDKKQKRKKVPSSPRQPNKRSKVANQVYCDECSLRIHELTERFHMETIQQEENNRIIMAHEKIVLCNQLRLQQAANVQRILTLCLP